MPCICQPLDLKERNGHSATCNRLGRNEVSRSRLQAIKKASHKQVNKVSDKMGSSLRIYNQQRKKFLQGKKCAVFPEKEATEVHHRKGRNTIELLLDEAHWLPVSREGHVKIELNPKWAKEQGFSEYRLTPEPHKI